MWSIAFRESLSRRFVFARSPMMWTIARRRASPRSRRADRSATCSRSSSFSSASDARGSWTIAVIRSLALCRIAGGALSVHGLLGGPANQVQLTFECDHLQFSPDHHFFELFEVQDLLLQLSLRFLQVSHGFF